MLLLLEWGFVVDLCYEVLEDLDLIILVRELDLIVFLDFYVLEGLLKGILGDISMNRLFGIEIF